MGPSLLALLAGLVVGRFLSVVVAAAPVGTPVREAVTIRPGCGCRAGPWGFLPLMWWLQNGGRCRLCRCRVGVVLPLVELVTAGAFAGTVYFVGAAWSLPAYLWFVSVSVVLAFVDVGHRLIPNRVLVPGTAVALLLLAGGAALDDRLGELPEALVTGAGYFLALLVPALLTRGAIGMGDAKLAFLLGLFAGYGRWEVALQAGVGAFVLAGAVAVLLLVLRVLARDDHIPFGPFMVLAAWIAIVRDLATTGT